ncbi:MAG: NAD(P)H-hydrate dehydratase [Bacteroidales bacterium]|jgi:NAD(P)H-hydrate epimerase|nr:NAD(P)H-hydrate dehydratase [Bacteroidales bacterium]
MKILSAQEIKTIDGYTIEHEPVTSVDLMERAALACTDWITRNFDRQWKIVVFAGPGNNGGDGLAIARQLYQRKYQVRVYLLTEPSRISEDAAVNFGRLRGIRPEVLTMDRMPEITAGFLVIDALFGVGLSRPLDGLAARIVDHINHTASKVVSIDIPSGLFCEDNRNNHPENIIRADHTLTFQQPKLSFFFSENDSYLGKWEVLDIGLLPDIIGQQASKNYVLQASDIASWVVPRKRFSHKGDYGHACIVAGRHSMMGAAVLSVRACLRSGVGLVTAHVPGKEGFIIQLSVPEALVSTDAHPEALSCIPDVDIYSAMAIGPGIGQDEETRQALITYLEKIRSSAIRNKLVFDADALNILSQHENGLDLLPQGCIITPHPKEFDRLAGNSGSGYERYLKQLEMARKYQIIVVLKGAYTTITTPEGHCFFNTTGNPGMATGGSGDVLTGIIVSLLAQGGTPVRAACAGVWIHGTAGDMAARENGDWSMIASDIVDFLGEAIRGITPAGNFKE